MSEELRFGDPPAGTRVGSVKGAVVGPAAAAGTAGALPGLSDKSWERSGGVAWGAFSGRSSMPPAEAGGVAGWAAGAASLAALAALR